MALTLHHFSLFVLPLQAGPLMLLKQAYEARGAVRVVTRHARGVRGVATGASQLGLSHAAKKLADAVAGLSTVHPGHMPIGNSAHQLP